MSSVGAKQSSPFLTHYTTEEIKRRSVRGGVATLAAQGAKFVLNLGSTVVLARLLSPQDFGLIAMVTAVTGFMMIFKDLGLSMATVQRAEINHNQVSTLFWINLGLSAALMLLTLALAPAVAWFYREPRLIAATAVLSTAFLFGGLTVQHQAILRRQMRLSAVAGVEVVAMAAGVLSAIVFAWAGWGYWSLVWMQIVTAATNAAGVWIASDWRPGRPVRRSGVGSMLSFGGNLTGFHIVNYFSRNFDNMLIGRFCGALPLGLYSRAYSLLLFPIAQITAPVTAVGVPTLSRLQNEPERYRRFYLKAVRFIAYVSMPLVAAMAALSPELIWMVLGREWMGAGPIFTVLAVAAIWQPVGATVGWVYVSRGQAHRMLAWGCISAPLIVLSFLIGLPWGAIGVATAYAVCITLIIVPSFSFALKQSPISVRDVFSVLYHPLALSLIVGLTMAIVRALTVDAGPIWTVAASVTAGAAVFFGLAAGLNSVWSDLRDLGEAWRAFLPKE